MGIDMKCGKATKLIGPFLDGELVRDKSEQLQAHIQSCPDCGGLLKTMSAMVDSLSSLATIEPSAQESYRLINRVRAEMQEPGPERVTRSRLRLTAAAITILVAASIGTTWAVLAGGEPATRVEVAPEEPQGGWFTGPVSASNLAGAARGQLVMANTTKPSVAVSATDYSASELKSFRNDLGTRLDFYSSYWYPALTSGLDTAGLAENQTKLTAQIADQAAQAGKNPDEVKQAIGAALSQSDQTIPLLPCYAEQAKVEGKDAWLISISGPEDYLLFTNQELPPSMYLAAQGGEASLKISETLLAQLATMLAPFYGTSYVSLQNNSFSDQGVQGTTPLEQTLSTVQAELSPEQQQQFQVFMRQIAAQSNNLDLIAALEGLNYNQLLMLVQGNWSGLAEQGVDLTRFLVPPNRLYAIDTTSGAVIWAGSKK